MTYKFTLLEDQTNSLNNQSENLDWNITGTYDISTSLKANAFIAKGSYYDMPKDVSKSIPKIVNSTGHEIVPNSEDDASYLIVDSKTGVCFVNKQRHFYNLVINSDELFKDNDIAGNQGQFLPLAYIKRELVWTQDQIDDAFGLNQNTTKKEVEKWVILGILILLGILCLVLSGYCFCKYNKQRKIRSQSRSTGSKNIGK